MAKKKEPYKCPRCGYTVDHRGSMRYHLYNLKKPCPATENEVDITDTIKEHILNNRIYKVVRLAPQAPQQIINQQINHYHQVNALICNMDMYEKLQHYLEYRQKELMNFGDMIEGDFKNRALRLDAGGCPNFFLTMENLKDLINEITKAIDVERLNVVFDELTNKVKIFDNGEWSEELIEPGIKTIFDILKTHYLDFYECHLIRKMHKAGVMEKAWLLEWVTIYYKFLGSFGIPPFVIGKNDCEILYPENDPRYDEDIDEKDPANFRVQEEFKALYKDIRENAAAEMHTLRKDIRDIIKSNSKKKMKELNKELKKLAKTDEEFMKLIVEEAV